jgi:hypothetical protein
MVFLMILMTSITDGCCVRIQTYAQQYAQAMETQWPDGEPEDTSEQVHG